MEAMERRGKLAAIAAIMFIVFWSQCRGVEGQRNNTKMSYVCPPQFIRLGHSCYYFSENKATWQAALFACTDRGSNLTVPARWEDRNLRKYLNKPDVVKESRWIGGIYDYGARSWRWGGDLRKMHYQSFSKMKKMTPEELKWHCIAMMPDLLYRWSPRNCVETRHYICQTKLQKVPKAKVKDLRRRWQRMGQINEITAPSVSREVNDPMMVNDVTVNPVHHPKSYDLRPNPYPRGKNRHGTRMNSSPTSKYDLRPNELKKRSRPIVHRRLKRPFPGYTWNRRDPEGSYQRNAELLRSGRTGLTPQQVNAHLARLRHLRDKQVARRKRLRDDDWLVNEPRQALAQTHARTYTVDNNISALHPKTIVEEFNMEFPHHPAGPPKSNRNTG
ncbi:uncharacterized protein LOC118281827 [Spodoptera frugiperda]|uniref:Uncharacterized protein LOC118281827 n=1 Tax=Spodoptera frugiperda TaxID=7108 RepID=A0A9R0DKF7_SPOFR|nr:uncharacterized protein LOC118281827 [Spodoptera frugiperda]XP_035458467.2 uncharacterized protein LOC118281827 [Spodoptera frugiperda]XP_035458475.2 uncharacterized protein LOC118281827 [Spodoptera frugiperda]